jgi:hypothetical protein
MVKIYRMDGDQLVTISVEELRNLRLQVQAQAAIVLQLQAQVINLENERRVRLLVQRIGVRSCVKEYARTKHLYSMR